MEYVTHHRDGEHKRSIYRVSSGNLSPTQSEYKSDILNTLSDMTVREKIIPEHHHVRQKYDDRTKRDFKKYSDVANTKSAHSRQSSETNDYWLGAGRSNNNNYHRKSKSAITIQSTTTLDIKYGDLKWIKPTYSSEETKNLTSVDVNENFTSPMPRKKDMLHKWESGDVYGINRLPSDSSLDLDDVRISTSESSDYIASEGSINSASSEMNNASIKINNTSTEINRSNELVKTEKSLFRFQEMRRHVKRMRGNKKSRMASELQSVSLPDVTSDEDDEPPLRSVHERVSAEQSPPVDIANISDEIVSFHKTSSDTSPPLSIETPQSSSQSLIYSDRSFSDNSDIIIDNDSSARRVKRKKCLRQQLFNRQNNDDITYPLNYPKSVSFENYTNRDNVCVIQQSYMSCLKADLLIKIFSYLPTRDVCRISKVCRKWYQLYLSVELWGSITINDFQASNIDDVINLLLQRLAFTSPYACLNLKTIQLDGCMYLSNKGLTCLAMRCPELKSIEIASCLKVTGEGIGFILANCPNMAYMNLAGCDNITDFTFSLNSGLKFGYHASFLELRYIDFSECTSLCDSSLRHLVKCASFLEFLYLRRCDSISNDGIEAVAENCVNLKEISLNECYNISDIGVTNLLKGCLALRYISLAKCTVTNTSIRSIVKYSKSLRHLNLHECEAVTDESIIELCTSCDRLRSIDLGKCFNITNSSMYALSQCKRLRRLSVNECTNVSDPGLRKLATNCKKLRHLDVRGCNFSLETYVYVKQRCKVCTIQHNRIDFF